MAKARGAAPAPSLSSVIAALERLHGKPPPPKQTDPFDLVLLENASYLVDDERRQAVFESIAEKVGTTPEALLAAKPAALIAAIKEGGMQPPMRAEKLRKAATLAKQTGLDRLRAMMREAPEQARNVLRRFPGIGEPGADKLLLFYRCVRSLAPDSNALRVLVRLGLAKEDANYEKTYRAAVAAVAPELPADYDALIEARALLRRHGQTICKRTAPACESCPLSASCAYFALPRPAPRSKAKASAK